LWINITTSLKIPHNYQQKGEIGLKTLIWEKKDNIYCTHFNLKQSTHTSSSCPLHCHNLTYAIYIVFLFSNKCLQAYFPLLLVIVWYLQACCNINPQQFKRSICDLHILLVLNNYTIFISLSRADLQIVLDIIIAQASLTIYHILLFVYKLLILNSDKMFLLNCTVII
jgi:hypothetical protein